MRRPIYVTSRVTSLICPACGLGRLRRGEGDSHGCERCERSWGGDVVEALRQIASLPDAAGIHACECGHPEMRLLPDGVRHCPSCGSEVLPSGTGPATASGPRRGRTKSKG